jgi:hypothetical protein
MATASWAMTAALTAACSRSSRACAISATGSLTTSRQTLLAEHLPDDGEVLLGQPAATIELKRGPHIIEAYKGGFVYAADRACERQELPAKLDGVGSRLYSISLPVGIDDPFGDVGMDQCGEPGEAFDSDAFMNRLPRGCDEFSATPANGRRLARPDALAIGAAPDPGKPFQVILDVRP